MSPKGIKFQHRQVRLVGRAWAVELPRCADHVGWALLTSGASGHGCFLAVKPNQPEDDGEYGVPDVALPNVALPIARGQRGCLTENPQYAHPLVSSVSVILPNFLCELQT